MQQELAELEQALAERESELGAEHPDTLAARGLLARAYRFVGRPADAITLAETNAPACARIFGPDDGRALTARNDLARAYAAAERQDESIALHRQVVADSERALGPDQLDTLLARLDLGYALSAARAAPPEELVSYFGQVLADCERVLGSDHPDTIYCRAALSAVSRRAGQTATACALAEENLASCERSAGPSDPATFTCRARLGSLYSAVGRGSEAFALLTEALAGLERTLGDLAFTNAARAGLAEALVRAGQKAEAIPLLTDVLAFTVRQRGPGHPAAVRCRIVLGAVYLAEARRDLAIPMLEAAVAQSHEARGPADPATLSARRALAAGYRQIGRLDDADRLYAQVAAEQEIAHGRDSPAAKAAREELATVRLHPLGRAGQGWLIDLTPRRRAAGAEPPLASRALPIAIFVLAAAAIAADVRLAAVNARRACAAVSIGSLESINAVLHCAAYSAASREILWLQAGVIASGLAGAGLLAVAWRARVQSAIGQAASLASLPAGYPLVGSRAVATAVRREEMAARFGPEAGGLAVQAEQAGYRKLQADCGVVLAQFVFAALFALLWHQALIAVIIVIVAGEMIMLEGGRQARARLQAARASLRAAQRAALGMDDWAVRTLPDGPAEYAAWCAAHGLAPYPFGEPAWET